MEKEQNMNSEIKSGATLDFIASHGNRTIEARGLVKDISEQSLLILLEITDKNMTLPVGTDLYVAGEGIIYNIIDSSNFPEVRIHKVDGRNYTRVDDVLSVNHKKISSDEYNQFSNTPSMIFQNIFGESLKIPEFEDVSLKMLYDLMYRVSLKMDRILSTLESTRLGKYESTDDTFINISGAGMRFITAPLYAIGDLIALQFMLPLVNQPIINVMGEVVKITESEQEGKCNTSVKFVDISEDDREVIIKYVFKRQRELLRG
jgi:hypothetical protein